MNSMNSYQQIMMSFSQLMEYLEQTGSRIPDAQSVKFTFSLKVIFYHIKTEKITKENI